MGDELKSAYELAMEKLVRKDKESGSGSSGVAKLNARQKKRIAEIRSEVEAKLAEREILFKSELRKARGEMGATQQIEEAYRRDRERLLSRQEERIREVKEGDTRK